MGSIEEATMSSKGQLVIPKHIRNQLGIHRGSKVWMHAQEGSVILVSKPDDPLKTLIELGNRYKIGDMKARIKEHRRKEHS